MSGSVMLWGLLFGSIGFGFFIYGRKQKKLAPVVCGVGLILSPYFLPDTIVLPATGFALMAVPYFIRH